MCRVFLYVGEFTYLYVGYSHVNTVLLQIVPHSTEEFDCVIVRGKVSNEKIVVEMLLWWYSGYGSPSSYASCSCTVSTRGADCCIPVFCI
jgi:hypothetical protein